MCIGLHLGCGLIALGLNSADCMACCWAAFLCRIWHSGKVCSQETVALGPRGKALRRNYVSRQLGVAKAYVWKGLSQDYMDRSCVGESGKARGPPSWLLT